MGYHSKKIQKGRLGEISKIKEEYEEFCDAVEQGNSIMKLVELSDLIGAIEAYTLARHNVTLDELIRMKNATKSAFEDGTRKSDNPCGEVALGRWTCIRCKTEVDMVSFRCECPSGPSPWEPIIKNRKQ